MRWETFWDVSCRSLKLSGVFGDLKMTGVDISIPRCFESLRGSRGVRRKGEIRETRTMDDLYLRERPVP